MKKRDLPLPCRGVLTVAFGMLCGFVSAAMPDVPEIALEGEYRGHLQDVWYDGSNTLYWAHTQDLLKTDLTGKILRRAKVTGHHAGIELKDGKLYIAVCKMQNTTGGKTTPECRVTIGEYDAETLSLVFDGKYNWIGHSARKDKSDPKSPFVSRLVRKRAK